MKEIYFGSDHAGFVLKEKVKEWLLHEGWVVHDVGAHFLDPKDDYPEYAEKLGRAIVAKKARGILFCGSAEGMSIAANKINGVRAVIVRDVKGVRLAREHNDANVLCLSGWWHSEKVSRKLIPLFMKTRFSGQARHIRRLKMIGKLEEAKEQ